MNQQGIGVMFNLLTGNKESERILTAAYGKKVTAVSLVNVNALHLEFDDATAIEFFDDGQSCCESRYMHTDDDLDALVGGELVSAEIKDAPSEKGANEDDYGEEHEVQFLVVQSTRAHVTIASHNEHNGYYGGFAICVRSAKLSKAS